MNDFFIFFRNPFKPVTNVSESKLPDPTNQRQTIKMSLLTHSRGIISLPVKGLALCKGTCPPSPRITQVLHQPGHKLCSFASTRKRLVFSLPRNLAAHSRYTSSLGIQKKLPLSRSYSQFIDDEEEAFQSKN